mgnify:CR=1 FL=1|tara:strand:- start:677 stop:1285 length:609 start_codon:yes stop_codon:yes gene_type:complete
MKIFEINNKDYNLPQDWNEVNLEMFERIVKHSGILSEYKSKILYAIEMFGILLDAPIDEIKKLDRKSYDILANNCEWATKEVVSSKRREWKLDGETWRSFDELNKLTMGDSISLELMINESNEQNLLTNILPILIRKEKKVTRGDKEITILEDFDAESYEETKQLFRKNIMVSDVIWLKDFFLNGEVISSTTSKVTSESHKK